jgi:hypothetical protein
MTPPIVPIAGLPTPATAEKPPITIWLADMHR